MLLPSLCMTILCYFLFFCYPHLPYCLGLYFIGSFFSQFRKFFIGYNQVHLDSFSIKVEKMKSMPINLLKIPAKRCI